MDNPVAVVLKTAIQLNKVKSLLTLFDDHTIKFDPPPRPDLGSLHLKDISHLQQAQGKPILKLFLHHANASSLIVSFTDPLLKFDHASIVREAIVSFLSTFNAKRDAVHTNDTALTSLPIQQELQLRADLLLKHRTLAKLHQDLVCTGHITELEFWSSRKPLLERACIEKTQLRGHKSSRPPDAPTQTGDNQLKLTITPQFIHATFLQYPSVHQLYNAKVPHELSEKEFWYSYARSKLYTDRNQSGPSLLKKKSANQHESSIFDACYIQESERLLNSQSVESVRPTLNIAATEVDHLDINGNAPDKMMRFTSGAALLKEFNQHSSRILQSALEHPHPPTMASQITSEVQLDDLTQHQEPAGIPIHLSSRPDTRTDSQSAHHLNTQQYAHAFQQVSLTIGSYINESTCQTVASTFNETIAANPIIRSATDDAQLSLEDLGVPSTIAATLTGLSGTATELLRHYWGAAKANPEKQKRVRLALEAHVDKIKAWVKQGHNRLILGVCQVMLDTLEHALKEGTC